MNKKNICNKNYIKRQLFRYGDKLIGMNDKQYGMTRQLI
jgi:hypothetical protein